MKNSTDQGFDHDCNVQAVVDQASLLIVGAALSNHLANTHEAEPSLKSILPKIGTLEAVALDHDFGEPSALDPCGYPCIEPYIARGREPHHQRWQERFALQPVPSPRGANPKSTMASKLKTILGQSIYGVRKCAVELVLCIITEGRGFRQFLLYDVEAPTGEWLLVCRVDHKKAPLCGAAANWRGHCTRAWNLSCGPPLVCLPFKLKRFHALSLVC